MGKTRKIKSIKIELIKKARESMLSAVQIFNNPLITFKSEIFITLAVIGWTYLLHAFYRSKKVDYRCFKKENDKKRYIKTNFGSTKLWSLDDCLKCQQCPLDDATKTNLKFLIGIRNEIEHQMTNQIDECLTSKLQACAIDFDYYITHLFGEKYKLSEQLSLAIQFSPLSPKQKDELTENHHITSNIKNFIVTFESGLPDNILMNNKYAYRIHFEAVSAGRSGTADETILFVKPGSPDAEQLEKKPVLVKETEKKKYLPKQIVKMMQDKGYKKFSVHIHTLLWKDKNAKVPGKGYGALVCNNWYWYDSWVKLVEDYCAENVKELN